MTGLLYWKAERGDANMPDVRVYLSHGGGVNSWALYLYLIEQGEVPGVDFEAIFVNHGTDWPETYEYMDMMIAKGYPVTVIRPEHDGCKTVYDFCQKWAIIPNRRPGSRWCTQHFKVLPLITYRQTPCIELIGFDSAEAKRVKGVIERDGAMPDFPLIAAGIDRGGVHRPNHAPRSADPAEVRMLYLLLSTPGAMDRTPREAP